MTLEEINRLKELKQLHDAGILTREEMLSEKAKLLGTAPTDGAGPEDETAQETEQKADGDGAAIVDKTDGQQENPAHTEEPPTEENGINKILLAFLLGVVIFVIIVAIASKSSDSQSSADYDYGVPMDSEVVVTDETPYNEDGYNAEYETEDASGSVDDSDDEFAFDPWIGSITLNGCAYRTCDIRAWLDFRKTSKGMYEGTAKIMLGDAIDEFKFAPDRGILTGTVRAKADGDILTVVLDDYTTKAGDIGDDFSGSPLKGQIFRIKHNDGSYTATAVGDMEGYFDGGGIYVSK